MYDPSTLLLANKNTFLLMSTIDLLSIDISKVRLILDADIQDKGTATVRMPS